MRIPKDSSFLLLETDKSYPVFVSVVDIAGSVKQGAEASRLDENVSIPFSVLFGL